MKVFNLRFISAIVCAAASTGFSALADTPAPSARSSFVVSAGSSPSFEAEPARPAARVTEWADMAHPDIASSTAVKSMTLEEWEMQYRSDDSTEADDDSLWQTVTPAGGSDYSVWSWLFGLASEEGTGLVDPMANVIVTVSDREPILTTAAAAGTETYALMLASLGALGFVTRRRED